MAITGRTLREAAQIFCDHVNRVLATTITQTRLQVIPSPTKPQVQLAFRQGGRHVTAPLRTRFGPMGLYLGQVCTSERTATGQHELRTVEYKYHLIPEGAPEALLRGEYVRTPEDSAGRWCRHHLQGPLFLALPAHPVSLNDLHLPTGYVALEEVLRFCLVDLGVPPLAAGWDQTFRARYALLKKDFTE